MASRHNTNIVDAADNLLAPLKRKLFEWQFSDKKAYQKAIKDNSAPPTPLTLLPGEHPFDDLKHQFGADAVLDPHYQRCPGHRKFAGNMTGKNIADLDIEVENRDGTLYVLANRTHIPSFL